MKVKVTINVLAIFVVLFSASCEFRQQSEQKATDSIDTTAFLKVGDSVTMLLQKILLENVMQATKAGGPEYAVEFCNERAIPLTDSISILYNCRIQRISDKPRNPLNQPSAADMLVLNRMKMPGQAKAELVSEAGSIVYYKPVKISMPACLNCHGNENGQINPNTLSVLKQKYPADKATGYKEGDLRGAWKITFQKSE